MNAVEEYQCCGCVNGPYPDCFVKDDVGIGCRKHYSGTSIGFPGVNKIFLGLPKGFNKLGMQKDLRPRIFETQEEQEKIWGYDKFNIPIWKHKNKEGHILVRGYMPRINEGFIHIILKGDFKKIKAKEITKKDMNGMD